MARSSYVCRDVVLGWSLYRRDDGRYYVATDDDYGHHEIPVSREYVSRLIDKMVPEV